MSKRIFQDQLHALMQRHGVKQEDIAKALGVSQSAVSRWIKGSVPRGDRLSKLASFFGISTDELLTTEKPIHSIQDAVALANQCPGDKRQKQQVFEQALDVRTEPTKKWMDRALIAEEKNKKLIKQFQRMRDQIDRILSGIEREKTASCKGG